LSSTSLIRQQFSYGWQITLCHLRGFPELAFPLRTLFGEDMSQMRLATFVATFTGATKSFRSTAIGFHLRHFLLLSLISAWLFKTGPGRRGYGLLTQNQTLF
jgi:hypothetical protein